MANSITLLEDFVKRQHQTIKISITDLSDIIAIHNDAVSMQGDLPLKLEFSYIYNENDFLIDTKQIIYTNDNFYKKYNDNR